MAGLQLKQRKPFVGDEERAGEAKAKTKATSTTAPVAAHSETADGADGDGGFDEIEEVLRGFDLDIKFGPCIGITRMERWTRAERLGLKPPASIRSLLEAMEPVVVRGNDRKDGAKTYAQSIWENRV